MSKRSRGSCSYTIYQDVGAVSMEQWVIALARHENEHSVYMMQ